MNDSAPIVFRHQELATVYRRLVLWQIGVQVAVWSVLGVVAAVFQVKPVIGFLFLPWQVFSQTILLALVGILGEEPAAKYGVWASLVLWTIFCLLAVSTQFLSALLFPGPVLFFDRGLRPEYLFFACCGSFLGGGILYCVAIVCLAPLWFLPIQIVQLSPSECKEAVPTFQFRLSQLFWLMGLFAVGTHVQRYAGQEALPGVIAVEVIGLMILLTLMVLKTGSIALPGLAFLLLGLLLLVNLADAFWRKDQILGPLLLGWSMFSGAFVECVLVMRWQGFRIVPD